MCPTHVDYLGENSLRGLLRYFDRVKFFVLSAECDLINPRNPDAVVRVVASVYDGHNFITELRHWTALWQLRGEEECNWHCDRAPKDTDPPPVDFSELEADISCKEAKQLYSAATKAWRGGVATYHVAIVSVSVSSGLLVPTLFLSRSLRRGIKGEGVAHVEDILLYTVCSTAFGSSSTCTRTWPGAADTGGISNTSSLEYITHGQ